MLAVAKARFSAVVASPLLRVAPRLSGAARKSNKAKPAGLAEVGAAAAAAASPQSHSAVFVTMKETLDNTLGVSAACAAVAPEAESGARDGEAVTAAAADVAAGGKVPPYYKPMNLHHTLYEGEVARRLCDAAAARQFRSPVWATAAALARCGSAVREGEAGVEVATTVQRVSLYNLEQTGAPDGVVSAALRHGEEGWPEWPDTPLSAAGRPHSRHVQRTLKAHPSYAHYTLPHWVTEEEAVILGTAVPPSQKGCGILITRRPQATPPPAAEAEKSLQAAQQSPASPEMDFYMLYNAAQLEDPAKVTRETCPPAFFCSASGRRYGIPLSLHMRRYCQTYNLGMLPMVVFLTASRLHRLGGELRPMEDEVPPFTSVINDEVVSLHHAETTTIHKELLRRAETLRREELDRITAVTV
ncbi:uncharacterized protein Tco025E_07355 [Trypanosoma conorhini]|uniref:Trypanosoma Tc-38 (p38) protein domain-containing protein n=1 Tax=Trypanosoma conorhini TaxID=83891 RepID=A0A422NPT4_9TRYP|nr:uncharacterized protein Tco025E_07355 [Trypanosoma conorhini]RNF07482.1 hypothetical protein Tco025E_07355 [Trypanosoma conorhini]